MTKLDIVDPRKLPRTLQLQLPNEGAFIRFSDPANHPRTLVLQMSNDAYTLITDAARALDMSPEAYIAQSIEHELDTGGAGA